MNPKRFFDSELFSCESDESDFVGEGGHELLTKCAVHNRMLSPAAQSAQPHHVVLSLQLTVAQLTSQNTQLMRRLEKLESLPQALTVPINTFAPKPFEAIKPIMVLVEPVLDDSGEPCEYVASFVDGAICSAGDTIEEAVAMVKDRMTTQYTLLTRLPPDRLGKRPRQQLDALQAVMRRIE
ncbi:MAG: hypothetical protein ABR915_12005 [Thermoguttaceae bacterium]|jgi:hypothetical protein